MITRAPSTISPRPRRSVTRLTCGGFVATVACLVSTSSIVSATGPTNGWSRVTSPNVGHTANELLSVASTSATDIWTVGWHQGSTNQQTLAEHSTNGSSWSIIGSQNASAGTDNQLAGVVAISPTNVWAVGSDFNNTNNAFQPLIQHSTGGGFTTVAPATLGTTINQELFAVYASSASDIWAVGQTLDAAYIQHFDGSAWSIVPSAGGDSLTAVSGTGPSDVWAVGYRTVNSAITPFAEHWNGTIWSVPTTPPLPVSTSYSYFEGLTAITLSDVWAVGVGEDTSTNTYRTLTEHWNGTAWVVVPSPNIGAAGNGNDLHAVSAASSSNVWAVGTSTGALDNDQALAEHWNGTAWSLASPPNPCTNQWVTTFAVDTIASTNVWAVGTTTCPRNATWVTLTFNRQ